MGNIPFITHASCEKALQRTEYNNPEYSTQRILRFLERINKTVADCTSFLFKLFCTHTRIALFGSKE
eukprot:m.372951 g.372951  ORF g.372951 m.372951 type:complete len:67 (+) comp20881_c0_seq4:1159-1359(+)